MGGGRLKTPRQPTIPSTGGTTERETVLPVISETATVRKRRIDTGRGVRISKTVIEREEIVDEPLERDELLIERVAVDQVVEGDDLPVVRHEGDVTIVPVLEEVIVAVKRTVLKEEVRITRVRRQVRDPQRLTLRSEQVVTERFDDGPAGIGPAPGETSEPTAGDPAGFTGPKEQ